jgi:hypothetical protein
MMHLSKLEKLLRKLKFVEEVGSLEAATASNTASGELILLALPRDPKSIHSF